MGGLGSEREAGVVDQKVDLAKTLGERGQSGVARRFVAHIEGGGMQPYRRRGRRPARRAARPGGQLRWRASRTQ